MLTASVETMLVTSIGTTLETGAVPIQYILEIHEPLHCFQWQVLCLVLVLNAKKWSYCISSLPINVNFNVEYVF